MVLGSVLCLPLIRQNRLTARSTPAAQDASDRESRKSSIETILADSIPQPCTGRKPDRGAARLV
jgi:hypothetical protein